eukprot:CAMPEP_0176016110 /NCGR_PEP_ID=MMETSP0120_2-20121206/7680_1 /TAXON_ID=160619 /ORGANISM="Kryptoperidinium foliaceum, Strain CCMP 1326" /LENGTH=347 /DNA_ID=CAMNT_0017349093 /DNA_START=55 /DNA_END=1098 /DNA_ORIENTATION=+
MEGAAVATFALPGSVPEPFDVPVIAAHTMEPPRSGSTSPRTCSEWSRSRSNSATSIASSGLWVPAAPPSQRAGFQKPRIDASAANASSRALHQSDPLSPMSPMSPVSCSHAVRWHTPEETLIIFDWDDTLCPTEHARMNPDCVEVDAGALQRHERLVANLLQVAASHAHVALVSMAGTGWIEECISRYMPSIKGVLDDLKIPILLAREDVPVAVRRCALGDGQEPSHFLKRRAMTKVIRQFYRRATYRRSQAKPRERSWKNVMSIGDSMAERLALQDVIFKHVQRDRQGRWKECRCKTLKLKSEPSLEELSAELQLVAEILPTLVHHDGDLDFELDDTEIGSALSRR